MNHEEFNNNDSTQTEIANSKTTERPASQKEEVLPPPTPHQPTPRVRVSIKKWSENQQRYFYKPKDPDYAKNSHWKHKHEMQSSTCGAIVSAAMLRHVKSLRCSMVKDAVKKALNNAHIEEVETPCQTETQ